jgi:hypothetical protein
MAIRNLQKKIDLVANVISNAAVVATFTVQNGSGPSLYFYKKLLDSRRRAGGIETFLDDQNNVELCYCVLGLWGMDTRAARLKDCSSFIRAIEEARPELVALESTLNQGKDVEQEDLGAVYDSLHLMQTGSKLVSNSKFLHFLLPDYLMPMDGMNTLMFLYGNTSESKKKYQEVIQFSSNVRSAIGQRNIAWAERLDDSWNSNIPKIIDNAIMFVMSVQTRMARTAAEAEAGSGSSGQEHL